MAERTPRSVTEMVDRLRDHVQLLKEYVRKAAEGDERYLGEVAAKLRLLVLNKGSNKALLLRLARLTEHGLKVRIGGAPGWEFIGGVRGGDTVSLERWLDMMAVAVQTPSSEGKLVTLTKGELVATWAQQFGGAHEDWSLDEGFQVAKDTGLYLAGVPAQAHQLIGMGNTVVRVAESYLDALTPARIETAEAKRRRQLKGAPTQGSVQAD